MKTHDAPAGPTTQARIGLLDELRGLALLGILVVNMEYYSQTIYDGWMQAQYSGALDLATRWVVIAFFQLKAYLLFALLFGYGIGLQLKSLNAANMKSFSSRHIRRMMVLAELGVAHAVLLFAGDILLTYAILGLACMNVWRAAPGRLVKCSAIVFSVGFVLSLAFLLALPEEAIDPAEIAAIRDVYANGSFVQVVTQRLNDAVIGFSFVLLIQGPTAFALMLVGVAMAKMGVLEAPGPHRSLLRSMAAIGLSVGLIGGAVSATLNVGNDQLGLASGIGFVVQMLTGPAFCLGLTALIALWRDARPSNSLVWARSAGRMSLSIYIGESLICAFLFTSHGLGLFAQVGPAWCFAIAIAIYLLLEILSGCWLRRYRFGPLEWLLRSATYAKWQPMRGR